jgi:hypothetical protein
MAFFSGAIGYGEQLDSGVVGGVHQGNRFSISHPMLTPEKTRNAAAIERPWFWFILSSRDNG